MFKGKFGIGRGYVSLINRGHVSLSVQAVQDTQLCCYYYYYYL